MWITYYSSKKKKNSNISICYCRGANSDFVIVPQNLREKFKLIYPLCNTCMKAGNHFINGWKRRLMEGQQKNKK